MRLYEEKLMDLEKELARGVRNFSPEEKDEIRKLVKEGVKNSLLLDELKVIKAWSPYPQRIYGGVKVSIQPYGYEATREVSFKDFEIPKDLSGFKGKDELMKYYEKEDDFFCRVPIKLIDELLNWLECKRPISIQFNIAVRVSNNRIVIELILNLLYEYYKYRV